MKNTIKILTFIAIFAVVISSCNKSPDLPMPELERVTTSFDQIPSIAKSSDGDFNFDYLNLGTADGIVSITCNDASLVSNAKLMVALNKDYANSGVYQVLTNIAGDYDVNPDGCVAALSALPVIDSIKPGDAFRFYLEYTLNGVDVKTFNDDGTEDFSAGMSNVPQLEFYQDFTVVCPYDINDYVGTFDRLEMDGTDIASTGSVQLELNGTGDSIICHDVIDANGAYYGLATALPVSFTFTIDPETYEVLAPDQEFIWFGDAYGGYGRIALEVVEGAVNTCSLTISFEADVTLPDSGYWFGRHSFEISPGSKNIVMTDGSKKARLMKR